MNEREKVYHPMQEKDEKETQNRANLKGEKNGNRILMHWRHLFTNKVWKVELNRNTTLAVLYTSNPISLSGFQVAINTKSHNLLATTDGNQTYAALLKDLQNGAAS